ncbi:MAG TPA: CPBP family intramembrane glutamic endopeptidase [Longimicrobiales bacterium]|nr:CPBP family intramembrane glutamic endopeptidase [Longimicrobiales bacterium]
MKPRLLRAAGLAVAVASALTYGLLDPLAWPARAFTTFLLVPLPAILVLQTRLVHLLPEDGDREAVYLSSAVSVWTLAAAAMLASRFSGFTRADLWLTSPAVPTLLGAAAATVAGGAALMAAARILHVRETPLIRFLLPRTGSEKIAFAGLSVSAGIAEELVFRAFLMAALLAAGATVPLTIALSVAAFAVSHAYQGMVGMIRVALLGALLTAPVLLTGSIYPAMIAHAALDLLAGLVLADWLAGEPDH